MRRVAVGLAFSLAWAATVSAEPTPLVVRVISKGAKFIGSGIGGVGIVVEDADSGRILASGRTSGGTGDTRHVMKTAHTRGTPLSAGGAASFEASIDIDEPTRVRVRALGPLAQRQAASEASSTQWVLPGRGVAAGDGWLLELPGFIVDVLAPPAYLQVRGVPREVEIAASVTMMCGCPVQPGGTWDATAYEIAAIVTRNGERFAEMPLAYAGEASQFSAKLTIEQPGVYLVTVTAFDPGSGNTGVDFTSVVVGE